MVVSIYSLANKDKVYVQMLTEDKKTIIAQREDDENYRDDEIVLNTVENWLKLTYQWDAYVPGLDKKDRGFELQSSCHIKNPQFKGKARVPTPTYLASRLLAPNIRQTFLCQLFNNTIPDSVYSEINPLKSDVFVFKPMKFKRLTEDLYQVILVSTVTERIGNKEVNEFYVNLIVTLQAIKPDLLVFGEEEPSLLRKQVNAFLSNGMLIVSLQEYKG
ncbi:MAG: hypothetical protein ACFBSE_02365 [Prochloraceae cyanobacterium]